MRYILLLRGVNIAGKHKVGMAELKVQFDLLGYKDVVSYLVGGNILFHTPLDKQTVREALEDIFSQSYPFPLPFVLLTEEELLEEAQGLPAWWAEEKGRRDVIFFDENADIDYIKNCMDNMPLHGEIAFVGKRAVFWAKLDEGEYVKTAYHNKLMKERFYKLSAIRPGNVFDHLVEMVR